MRNLHSTSARRPHPLLGNLTTPVAIDSPTLAADLGLDWTVRTTGSYVLDQDANPRPIPGRLAVVRDDTGAPLGVVGTRYEPVQNAVILDTIKAVSDPGSAVTGLQVLDGGARFHLVTSVPGLSGAIRGDAMDGRLVISNAHDGSGSLRISLLILRQICSNGMVGWSADGRHTMRHTLSINSRVDAVRTAYRETIAQFAGMVSRLEVLADTPASPKNLERITLAAFGLTLADLADETERSRTIRTNKQREIAHLRRSETNQTQGTGQTLFSDLQAVTEFINHGRGDDDGTGILDGTGADMIERATAEAFHIATHA